MKFRNVDASCIVQLKTGVTAALQFARKVYDSVMDKLIAPNGQEVLKTVTESGATGYVAASIPTQALPGWQVKLQRALKRNLEESSALPHSGKSVTA